MLDSAVEPRLRGEFLIELARVSLHAGGGSSAVELARSALSEAGDDERLQAEAALMLASALLFMREDLPTAARYAGRAADLALGLDDSGLLADALSTRAMLDGFLGEASARETFRAASELREPALKRRLLGWPTFLPAYLLLWIDEAVTAAASLREHLADARARGDEGSLPWIVAALALAEYMAGRWEEAARLAEEGYEIALQSGQRTQRASSLSTRALVRASLGLENEARADAQEALALAGEHDMAGARINTIWALGLLELSLDRADAAIALLAPARQRFTAAGVREPGSIRFVPDEVEALIALGRADEADRVLDWLERQARALDRASALAAAARGRGLLAASRGDQDAALAAFARALEQHERISMPFERARTLLALGAAQRRSMQRASARETLGEALATFERLGAGLWAAKATGELARLGGRTPAGDELTVGERRIAELVAQGLSNKQVAAALFLTPKTVETKLSRIYAKLGVHSRTQLAAWLQARGESAGKL
ncbi:MAG: LuxR C-terminal-related transcriptional regulator [Actinobacteria bacterium]|nr:LuxR C-terminal-related transcriptional regulator [Actinomycetota bacterium]